MRYTSQRKFAATSFSGSSVLLFRESILVATGHVPMRTNEMRAEGGPWLNFVHSIQVYLGEGETDWVFFPNSAHILKVDF